MAAIVLLPLWTAGVGAGAVLVIRAENRERRLMSALPGPSLRIDDAPTIPSERVFVNQYLHETIG